MGRRIAKVVVVGAACVAIGLVGLYLVGMNLFLRTRAFRDAIGFEPGSLLVEYDSAYSLVPGSIHVDGLRIRGRDSAIEWTLALDHCDFRTSFAELLDRRFHASHVVGDGLSLRLRRRVDSITPEEMAATPSIAGFLDPPLTDSGPPLPPLTDATYRLWSVRLDGVDARHVREIWIDTMRYSGDLEVRGDWLFRPLRQLEITHATVDVHPLTVSWGEAEPWLSDASGSLKIECHPTPLQQIRGAELLHQFSLSGALGGVVHAASIARRVAPGVRAVAGDAAMDAQIAIDRGVVGPGTDVRLRPFHGRVLVTDLTFDASLSARARVESDGLGAATFEVGSLDVSQAGFTRGRATRMTATFRSHDLDLVHPFADATYALDVAGAQTDSLRFWGARLAQWPGVQVDSGVATASGHLEGVVAARTGAGHFDVGVRDAVLTSGDAAMTATTVALDVKTVHVSFLQGHGGRPAVRGEGELSVGNLRGSYKGASAVAASVEVRANLQAGSAGARGNLSIGASDVDVPSLARLAQLVPLGPLSVDGGSAHGELSVRMNLGTGVADGEARLTSRGLRARLGSRALQGVLGLVVKARRADDQTDLSGTRVVFTGDSASEETNWWARAEASTCVLRMGPTASLRARLQGFAKDGSPLTAVLSESAGIPNFLIDLVSTKALEISGDLVVAPSIFEARSVRAHGDGFDADLEYAALGAEKRWALALDLGLVRVGVHSADEQTEVVLFDVKPWFDARVASLRSSEPAVPP